MVLLKKVSRGAQLRLQAEFQGGTTRVTEAYAEPPLCIRQPKNAGLAAQVYLSALGGGFLPYDHNHVHVKAGTGATLFLGSQAANRVFKSRGMTCRQALYGEVGADALLVHCPDATTPFADSSFHQSQHWVLCPGARLVLGEVFHAGRLSRNEVYAMHNYRSDWRVTTPDGRPLLLDRISLDPGAMAEGTLQVPGCLALPKTEMPLALDRGVFTHAASFAFCGPGWEAVEASVQGAWEASPQWPWGITGPDEARQEVDRGWLAAIWRKDPKVLMARVLARGRRELECAIAPLHEALASKTALGFSPWARKF